MKTSHVISIIITITLLIGILGFFVISQDNPAEEQSQNHFTETVPSNTDSSSTNGTSQEKLISDQMVSTLQWGVPIIWGIILAGYIFKRQVLDDDT